MAKKEFSKFFIASLKRTAMNVYPLVKKKQKLQEEINEINKELEDIQNQLNTYEAPIFSLTGYTTEDLVVRTVETTDKKDKNGNTIKITKWSLKYPKTIIPDTTEDSVNTEENNELNNEFETEENNTSEEMF